MSVRFKFRITIQFFSLSLLLYFSAAFIAEIYHPILAVAVGLLSASAATLIYKFRISSLYLFLGCLGTAFLFLYPLVGLLPLSNFSPVRTAYLFLRLARLPLFLTITFSFFTTLVFCRHETARKALPPVNLLLLALCLWSQANFTITIFPHPIIAALFIFLFCSLQVLQLVLQEQFKFSSAAFYGLFVFVFIFGSVYAYRFFIAGSVSNRGGLIQPTLFQFDFSPYLSLRDEIKLNDDLVLVAHLPPESLTVFLRRTWLSGWNREQGFFEQQAPDENAQLKKLPRRPVSLPEVTYTERSEIFQEYFIVNFDPTSFIAMDSPQEINPYQLWDESSFKSSYAVTSRCSIQFPLAIISVPKPNAGESEGLSEADLAFYTAIDPVTKLMLQDLALSLTEKFETYFDKVYFVEQYLKNGDYRYSLSPGIAPDGDQLRYFLFETKQGYCTYFAFSMTLLLRSVGIPARVAAGFFVDPANGNLDYYPIRSNTAHAWVEVYFPGFGWIAFDPTTNQLADGQEIPPGGSADPEQFTALLKEIITNRRFLLTENKEDVADQADISGTDSFIKIIRRGITFFAPVLLVIVMLLLSRSFWYPSLMLLFIQDKRKKIAFMSQILYHRLPGYAKSAENFSSRHDFIQSLNNPPLNDFFALQQKALFAPLISSVDVEEATRLFQDLTKLYPAALNRWLQSLRKILPLGLFLLCALSLSPLHAQNEAQLPRFPDELLETAAEAVQTENWDRAISALQEGEWLYPNDYRFAFQMGEIFFERKLYQLAYEYLQKALQLGYTESYIYKMLSESAGYLNLDEEALSFITEFLKVNPDDTYAWSNYGWLCYKTHRIDQGIAALQNILARDESDSSLYAGLGNLYTAAYNYEAAKTNYSLAVAKADASGLLYLKSIYLYNRSIMEGTFYNFARAYDDAYLSLQASDQASGHLMLGELELRKLDFSASLSHYRSGAMRDESPLASMGIVTCYIRAGYPEEAQKMLTAILKKDNLSWIANYGTSTDLFDRDIHSMQADIHRLQMNKLKHTFFHNLSTSIPGGFTQVIHRIKYWYHDALYRIRSRAIGAYYEKNSLLYNTINEQKLHINTYYYQAFNPWRRATLSFLDKAEQIETTLIPAAQPSYTAIRGILQKDNQLLDLAIQQLDPVWEQNYLEQTVAHRILNTPWYQKNQTTELRTLLFKLNPAALVYYNIRLPVNIQITSSNNPAFRIRSSKFKSYFHKTFFMHKKDALLELVVTTNDTELLISLRHKESGASLHTESAPLEGFNSTTAAQLINRFSTIVFRTTL